MAAVAREQQEWAASQRQEVCAKQSEQRWYPH